MASFFTASKRFVRLIEWDTRSLWGADPMRCASARKSRASARVMLATLRIWRSPQSRRVVIELRDAVQMNRVDRHHAAFAQAGERGNHHVAAGRKGHGAIERNGRPVLFSADPCCAERAREFAVRFAAGGNVDLAIPRVQHGDGEVRRKRRSRKGLRARLRRRRPRAGCGSR